MGGGTLARGRVSERARASASAAPPPHPPGTVTVRRPPPGHGPPAAVRLEGGAPPGGGGLASAAADVRQPGEWEARWRAAPRHGDGPGRGRCGRIPVDGWRRQRWMSCAPFPRVGQPSAGVCRCPAALDAQPQSVLRWCRPFSAYRLVPAPTRLTVLPTSPTSAVFLGLSSLPFLFPTFPSSPPSPSPNYPVFAPLLL